ncbi:hypothetical protein [Nocardia huaxiensis]|uniref:hypothetical protein n=1 Tax=Nocardia huaxiensis TaxID=2755382 RepID=UPI001E50017F|nr:hypothetical protein [Nocardia huaxiensis]UFS98754.1 hypothetical protein LPY97_13090 [Nocardia huaxiensis]
MATVAAALAVTATLAGCGSDDKNSSTTTSAAATTTSQDHSAAPAPTKDQLQALLTKFADPTLSADDKAKLVVDGDKRKALIETMNKGLANYTVTFAVGDITADGHDKATAKVAVTSPHGTMPDVPMSFQYAGGEWKLSDAGACSILGMARAACQP